MKPIKIMNEWNFDNIDDVCRTVDMLCSLDGGVQGEGMNPLALLECYLRYLYPKKKFMLFDVDENIKGKYIIFEVED